MDHLQVLREYGWLALAIFWLTPRVWAFVEKYIPQRVQAREAAAESERVSREEGIRAEREARVTLMKSQLDREEREFEHRQEMDKRTVAALETMSLGIATGNERIAALIASHSQHVNFQFGAHVEIKEKLDSLQELISYKQRVEELERELTDTKNKIKVPPRV